MDGSAAARVLPDDGRVADAVPDHFVHRILPRRLWPYAQLARWERPIGWWLLLWPCWWSLTLCLATTGDWSPAMLLAFPLFLVGAVAMRGAGCTYNDIVDARLDARVSRTASRPIPSGRVSRGRAVAFTAVQGAAGFAVLLALSFLNGAFDPFVFLLGLASLAVVATYPFAKRVTDWPQFVLGLAFSWGALMGSAVVVGTVTPAALALYGAAIAWTIGYDTIYAHQDREDDALIGVRSTARLFGRRSRMAVAVLYALTVAGLAAAFLLAGAGWPAYAGLAAATCHLAWQVVRLDIDDPDGCLALFRANSQVGWLVLAGLAGDLAASGL